MMIVIVLVDEITWQGGLSMLLKVVLRGSFSSLLHRVHGSTWHDI